MAKNQSLTQLVTKKVMSGGKSFSVTRQVQYRKPSTKDNLSHIVYWEVEKLDSNGQPIILQEAVIDNESETVISEAVYEKEWQPYCKKNKDGFFESLNPNYLDAELETFIQFANETWSFAYQQVQQANKERLRQLKKVQEDKDRIAEYARKQKLRQAAFGLDTNKNNQKSVSETSVINPNTGERVDTNQLKSELEKQEILEVKQQPEDRKQLAAILAKYAELNIPLPEQYHSFKSALERQDYQAWKLIEILNTDLAWRIVFIETGNNQQDTENTVETIESNDTSVLEVPTVTLPDLPTTPLDPDPVVATPAKNGRRKPRS